LNGLDREINEVEEIDLRSCNEKESYYIENGFISTIKVDNFALDLEDNDVDESVYIPSGILSSLKETQTNDQQSNLNLLLSQFENDLLDDEDSEHDELDADNDTNMDHQLPKLICLEEDILTIDCGDDDDDSIDEDNNARQLRMESLCGTFSSVSIQSDITELQSLLSQKRLNLMNILEVATYNTEDSRSFTEVLPFD